MKDFALANRPSVHSGGVGRGGSAINGATVASFDIVATKNSSFVIEKEEEKKNLSKGLRLFHDLEIEPHSHTFK